MNNQHNIGQAERAARLQRYGDKLMYSVDELEEITPPRWLRFEGWLPAEQLVLLYGEEGMYKSFIAQGVSLDLAAHGHTVLYIAGEGIGGIRARVPAWRALRPPNIVMGPWQVTEVSFAMQDYSERKAWMDAMEEELDRRGLELPDLVVVDTLARNFIGGDENSARDMGLFIDGAEDMRVRWETTVLLIHHETRDTGRERGSTALKAAMFASWHTYLGQPVKGGAAVSMECDKMKDAKPPEPIRVRLQAVEDVMRDEQTGERLVTSDSLAWGRPFHNCDPAESSRQAKKRAKEAEQMRKVAPTPAKLTKAEIVRLAGERPITAGDLPGYSSRAAGQILNEMKQKGELVEAPSVNSRRAYAAT